MRHTAKNTRRLIQLAISLCGNRERVVRALHADAEEFARWEAGEATIPTTRFQLLADLIMERQGQLLKQNRAAIAELRKKRPD